VTTLVDAAGKVASRTMLDPTTLRFAGVRDSEVSKTLDTTCSPSILYPITRGKTYKCASTVQVNGKLLTNHTQMEFDQAMFDGRNLIYFCYLDIEEDGEYKITARICSSPDGKWVRSVNILDVTKIEPI
jgi:hypothetical protein